MGALLATRVDFDSKQNKLVISNRLHDEVNESDYTQKQIEINYGIKDSLLPQLQIKPPIRKSSTHHNHHKHQPNDPAVEIVQDDMKIEPSSSSNIDTVTISHARPSRNEGINCFDSHDTPHNHYTPNCQMVTQRKKDVSTDEEKSQTQSRKESNDSCIGYNISEFDCGALKGLLNAMNKYSKYINNNYNDEQNDELNIDFKKVLNDFLHLWEFHNDDEQFGKIANKLEFCDVTKCKMFKQNYRNRMEHNNNNIFSKLFGGNDDNDKINSNYQILNTIHCFYQHSYDLGHRLTSQEKMEIEKRAETSTPKQNVQRMKILPKKRRKYKHLETINSRLNTKYNQLCSDDNINNIVDNTFYLGMEFCYNDIGEEQKEEKQQYPEILMIKPKYSCLKEELTQNEISRLNIQQFDNEWKKATIKFNSYYRKKYYCRHKKKQHQTFTVEHIFSIMIYCNYDTLQYKFSKTYRGSATYKHDNFYHLGKNLKIAINEFGTKIKDSHIERFYHGINKKLLPSQIIGGVKIFCPLSTTSSRSVALNFTNDNNGLILAFGGNYRLNRTKAHLGLQLLGETKYFSVSWLSDYASEAEYLFIQNQHPLQIVNILQVDLGYKYEMILLSLTIIDQIISNECLEWNHDDAKHIKTLITSIIHYQLSHKMEDTKFESLQPYGKELIDVYFKNKRKLKINYSKIQKEYHFLAKILFIDGYQSIRLDPINTLFPNVEEIEISNINLLKIMDCIWQFLNDQNTKIPFNQRTKIQKFIIKASTNNECGEINHYYTKEFAKQQFHLKYHHKQFEISRIKHEPKNNGHVVNIGTKGISQNNTNHASTVYSVGYTPVKPDENNKCITETATRIEGESHNDIKPEQSDTNYHSFKLFFEIMMAFSEIIATTIIIWICWDIDHGCNHSIPFAVTFTSRNMLTAPFYIYGYCQNDEKRSLWYAINTIIHFMFIFVLVVFLVITDSICNKTLIWYYCVCIITIVGFKELFRMLIEITCIFCVLCWCFPCILHELL